MSSSSNGNSSHHTELAAASAQLAQVPLASSSFPAAAYPLCGNSFTVFLFSCEMLLHMRATFTRPRRGGFFCVLAVEIIICRAHLVAACRCVDLLLREGQHDCLHAPGDYQAFKWVFGPV